MGERKEYVMTQKDLDSMLDRIKIARNTSGMLLSGGQPMSSPQETANFCWQELGKRMGFKGMTAQPHVNGNPLWFTAEPIEPIMTS